MRILSLPTYSFAEGVGSGCFTPGAVAYTASAENSGVSPSAGALASRTSAAAPRAHTRQWRAAACTRAVPTSVWRARIGIPGSECMHPIFHAGAGFRWGAPGRLGLKVLLLLLLGEQRADVLDGLCVDRLDRANPVVGGDRRIDAYAAGLRLLDREQPSHLRLLLGVEAEAVREASGGLAVRGRTSSIGCPRHGLRRCNVRVRGATRGGV